jgi:uncharacterized protein YkwD
MKTFLSLLVLLLFTLSADQAFSQKKKVVPPTKSQPAATTSTAPLIHLSKSEEQVLAEINLARSNPMQYATYVTEFRRQYIGNEIRFADGNFLVTNEGVAAVDEAIQFLRSARAQGPLEARTGLIMAARSHLEDLLKTGRSGHKGSDGSSVEDRFNRFGAWSDSVGEDIVYHTRSPRENVISLIIDDGVSNRGHRKNIFKPTFSVVGIALGSEIHTRKIGIITFAGGYIDKPLQKSATSIPSARKL